MKNFKLEVKCKELTIDLELSFYDVPAMRRSFDWYSNYFAKKSVKNYTMKEIRIAK